VIHIENLLRTLQLFYFHLSESPSYISNKHEVYHTTGCTWYMPAFVIFTCRSDKRKRFAWSVRHRLIKQHFSVVHTPQSNGPVCKSTFVYVHIMHTD
jgi:hypothetical protein